ncbi:TonB-dependent receptor domain-containing protein [Rheinheimera maricola]|uniref:TonB-dependent receptor n=1 Tax=Rheinheimera maricola TaxID=2793282 RepID=A0ABS7X8W6_9GAMM|nr:TonB-dependent receptor [Rheinheimera maricola]MBZ9611971.1 TonB-dependent receptor [Rheinheimera maricola]
MFKPSFGAMLVATCIVSAYAEDIEHISIYANRSASEQQHVLASITVLEREDIVARHATDLPALLAQLPGINLSRDGGRGQSSGVYIRGGNTGHTLVLIDGVRTGSATLGYKSLAMLPLELIERIEVIRGPRAAWYGSDALAGVIAISTRRAQAVELNANIGSFGQAGTDISLSHSAEQLTLRSTAGVSRSDGFNVREDLDPDSDGYEQKFFKLAADYQTALGQLTAQADVNSGLYQFDTAWGSEDQADTLSRAYLLGWQQQFGQWLHQAQVSRNLDRETTFGPDSRSPFNTRRDEFNYQTTTDLSTKLRLLAGINWYQEQVSKAAPDYEQDSRINRALFAGAEYQQDALQLEAVLRRDLIDQYGGNNTWQLAAGYQFSPYWLVRASRGTAFKAPSFNELYFPGFANPELKPQQSMSDELALRYKHAGLNLQFAWFDREVTNLIQGVEQAENVLLASIRGIEFSLSQQWHQFHSQLAYTWLHTQNRSTGLKLERRPEHTLNWRGSYDSDTWSVFVTSDYQSETYQGAFAPVANLAGFTLWGLGGNYQISSAFVLRVKLDNVFDKRYQSSAGYATAGANFGISINFTPQ